MNDGPVADSHTSLTLLTRRRCSHCDHVVLALELLKARYSFDYRTIDIDTADLAGEFGDRIPVLLRDDEVIFEGIPDPANVEAALKRTCSRAAG
jgi:hypothetical protein